VEFLPDSGQNGWRAGETMTRRSRRNHSPAFKAKVALARKLAVVLHRMLTDQTRFVADKAAAAV